MAKTSKTSTLTAIQSIAITELVKGSRDEEAAKVAGVARSTVNYWKRCDPDFLIELNRQVNLVRRATISGHVDLIRQATEAALACVLNAIKAGDITTSKWLLDSATGLKDEVSKAFRVVTEIPELLPEADEEIMLIVAGNMATEILKENGCDELTTQLHHPEMTAKALKALETGYLQEGGRNL